MPSRQDALAALYAEKADELRSAVRRALAGPDELVDDACSIAWCQLVATDRIDPTSENFGWLYVVAIRAGYHLSARSRREPALGRPDDLPGAGRAAAEPADVVLDRLEQTRVRRELIQALPGRKRALVVLHGAGFSYREIAAITGATLRTIERQLLRGKRTLRKLDATTEAQ